MEGERVWGTSEGVVKISMDMGGSQKGWCSEEKEELEGEEDLRRE